MTTWMTEAYKHLGLREVPGKGNNPTIVRWLTTLKAWWSDDATPWCGTFVAYCMKSAGYTPAKHYYRAKDWLNWGLPIAKPAVGCIVVFERKGGGHVGFVVGKDKAGNLMVLGGNQGDAVSIAPFDRSRVVGYRWPDASFGVLGNLPVIASNGKLSTNEA